MTLCRPDSPTLRYPSVNTSLYCNSNLSPPPSARLALLRLAQEADHLHRDFPARGQMLRALASSTSAREKIVAPFLRSEHQYVVHRAGRTEQPRGDRDPLRGLRGGVESWFGTVLLADLDFEDEKNGLLRLHLNERRPRIDDLSLDLLRGKLEVRSERRNRMAIARTEKLDGRSGRAIRDARKTPKAVAESLMNLPSLYADKAEAALGKRKSIKFGGTEPSRFETRGPKRRKVQVNSPEQAVVSTCHKCRPSGNLLRNECGHCQKIREMLSRRQKMEFPVHSGKESSNDQRRTAEVEDWETSPPPKVLTPTEQAAKRKADRQAALATLEGSQPFPNFSRKIQPRALITSSSTISAPSHPTNLQKPLPSLPAQSERIHAHRPPPCSLYTAGLQYFFDVLSSHSQAKDEPIPIGWWQQDESHRTHQEGGQLRKECRSRDGSYSRGEGRQVIWHDE